MCVFLCRDIAKQLVLTPQWPLLLRHTLPGDMYTTTFREMIRKMPGTKLQCIALLQQFTRTVNVKAACPTIAKGV